jgi:glucokinase
MEDKSSLVGVDLGGTNIRAGLIREGSVKKLESDRINAMGSETEVLDQMFAVVDAVFERGVKAIGVGVPTVVDIEKGIVYDTQNIPSWKTVHLKSILEQRYRCSVFVNNDANCFVLGEKYYGQAQDFNDVVGLIVGTGLGAGLVLNGKLYPGINCGAGEFGMIPYKEHHLEYYASGQFFNNFYDVRGEELFDMAMQGDEEARRVFREFGVNFSDAVKAILYAVDPEVIVLGGSVSKAFDLYKNAMWDKLRSFAYSKVLDNIKIVVSTISHIGVLGAAALYYDAKV